MKANFEKVNRITKSNTFEIVCLIVVIISTLIDSPLLASIILMFFIRNAWIEIVALKRSAKLNRFIGS